MEEEKAPGVFASLRGALGSALSLLQTRLMLLATEVEEEKQRFATLLMWGLAATLALGVGLVFLAIFITALLWDTHRLQVLGACAAAFGVFGVVAGVFFLRLLRTPSTLFAASLSELTQDRASLRGQASQDGAAGESTERTSE